MLLPEVMGPPEIFGPPLEVGPVYGPEQAQTKPIVLVLGPGMARGFAFVGVLEALNEKKIPIGAIFGSEMGALIGALYATSSSINQFEWNVMKLKEGLFLAHSLLGGQKVHLASGGSLAKHIQQAFGDKRASDASIPIYIGAASNQGAFEVLAAGNLAQMVQSSLAFSVSRAALSSGPHEKQIQGWEQLIAYAMAQNLGPVVVVDVLSSKDSSSSGHSVGLEVLHIRPDLTGISYLDFNRKTEAAFRGKSAIIQNTEEIKHRVGGLLIRE